jgi:hypothetical protein
MEKSSMPAVAPTFASQLDAAGAPAAPALLAPPLAVAAPPVEAAGCPPDVAVTCAPPELPPLLDSAPPDAAGSAPPLALPPLAPPLALPSFLPPLALLPLEPVPPVDVLVPLPEAGDSPQARAQSAAGTQRKKSDLRKLPIHASLPQLTRRFNSKPCAAQPARKSPRFYDMPGSSAFFVRFPADSRHAKPLAALGLTP